MGRLLALVKALQKHPLEARAQHQLPSLQVQTTRESSARPGRRRPLCMLGPPAASSRRPAPLVFRQAAARWLTAEFQACHGAAGGVTLLAPAPALPGSADDRHRRRLPPPRMQC